MAAPAGTERSRPAASAPINGSAGAAAEHIHAATAGIVAAAAAAPTAREDAPSWCSFFEWLGTAFLQLRRALYVRPTCGLGRFRVVVPSPRE